MNTSVLWKHGMNIGDYVTKDVSSRACAWSMLPGDMVTWKAPHFFSEFPVVAGSRGIVVYASDYGEVSVLWSV